MPIRRQHSTLRRRSTSSAATGKHHRSRGQSLAEFTLVTPILLILLLVVADFSRLFAAGITVESAARTAAEVGAGEYLRALGSPADVALGSSADYDRVHSYAWESVCDETKNLAGVAYTSPSTECSGIPTLVCVHDDSDPSCGTVYNASGGIPTQCSGLMPGAAPTNARPSSGDTSRYVEVRVCYRFTSVFALEIPFFGVRLSPLGGDYFLEKTRTFTVADY